MLCVLFVHDSSDEEPPLREAVGGHHSRRIDHRSDAALHILRAAAVKTPIRFARIERRRHPLDADRVYVSAEHQRTSRLASVDHPDDVRTSRRHLLNDDVEAKTTEVRSDRGGDGALTRCARHEHRVHGIDGDELP